MADLPFSTNRHFFGQQLPDLGSLWRLLKELLWAYGLGFIWLLAFGASFQLSPLAAIACGFLVVGLFAFFHIVRTNLRVRATARLRPLRLPWTLLAAGIGVAASLTLFAGLSQSLWLPSTPNPGGGAEALSKHPGGFLSVVFLTALFPVIEEFVFRGWIQRPIERLFGPWLAVPTAALLFAVTHSGVEWPLTQFAVGCFYGAAVWATRSIWACVLLHMAGNLSVSVVIGFQKFYPSFFAEMEQHLSKQEASVALVLLLTLCFAFATWWIRRVARCSRCVALM